MCVDFRFKEKSMYHGWQAAKDKQRLFAFSELGCCFLCEADRGSSFTEKSLYVCSGQSQLNCNLKQNDRIAAVQLIKILPSKIFLILFQTREHLY